VVAFALRYRKEPSLRGVWTLMIGMVVVQFLLGVFTLLTQVQISLGVAHQFGALLLLAVMLIALHRTGRGITASAA
jgi:cytochrome c oxidase assembly protein subunit 15